MIFVSGTINIDPAHALEFASDITALFPTVRAEAGCLQYALHLEDAATGRFNVIERWADDAALVVHLKQPWIVDFYGKYIAHVQAMDMHVYDVAGVRDLPQA